MATGIPKEVYPLSTQDGDAIPLDVIRPLGVLVQAFVAGTGETIALPTGYPVVVIHADKACFIGFDADPADLVDGAFLADILYIPEASTITVSVPEGTTNISIMGQAEAGVAVIQMVQQWASISLQTQTVRI